jgi:hypothetical protein
MSNRKAFNLLGLAVATGAAAAWWVLVASNNRPVNASRRQVLDVDAWTVVGPCHPLPLECAGART